MEGSEVDGDSSVIQVWARELTIPSRPYWIGRWYEALHSLLASLLTPSKGEAWVAIRIIVLYENPQKAVERDLCHHHDRVLNNTACELLERASSVAHAQCLTFQSCFSGVWTGRRTCWSGSGRKSGIVYLKKQKQIKSRCIYVEPARFSSVSVNINGRWTCDIYYERTVNEMF